MNAGLAIEQLKKPGEQHCFLVEEVIPTTEGSFKKYLNNASAVPCDFIDESDNDRAEFLAFAQHVQYVQTKKRAYVADFQGRSSLLVDAHGVLIGRSCRWNHSFNRPSNFNKQVIESL